MEGRGEHVVFIYLDCFCYCGCILTPAGTTGDSQSVDRGKAMALYFSRK